MSLLRSLYALSVISPKGNASNASFEITSLACMAWFAATSYWPLRYGLKAKEGSGVGSGKEGASVNLL